MIIVKARKTTPAQRKAIRKWQNRNKGLKRVYQLRSNVRKYLRIASLQALISLRLGVEQAIQRKENE